MFHDRMGSGNDICDEIREIAGVLGWHLCVDRFNCTTQHLLCDNNCVWIADQISRLNVRTNVKGGCCCFHLDVNCSFCRKEIVFLSQIYHPHPQLRFCQVSKRKECTISNHPQTINIHKTV